MGSADREPPDIGPDYSTLPEPEPYVTEHSGFIWQLNITGGQQPERARACGFGDKDRRPVCPPPCVKLIVRDAVTGQDVHPKNLDPTYYVCTVDLWNKECDKEQNLVKSNTSSSPSISSVLTAAYPRTFTDPSYPPGQGPYPQGNGSAMPTYTGGSNYSSPIVTTPTSALSYSQHPGSYSEDRKSSFPSIYGNGSAPYYNSPQSQYANEFQGWGSSGYTPRTSTTSHSANYMMSPPDLATIPTAGGMYTRNLIGNLSASAFVLKDLEEKEGVWFILQDLSVRAEGWFRLKFTFVNLQRPGSHTFDAADNESGLIQAGSSAPVLASVYSKPFYVYSAKKFPGVIESTPLSKHFANQGIKIPIRKEPKDGDKRKRKRNRNGDDDDEEDEDDE